jgi:tetratricopeptide (TPR) repeat protein
VSKWEAMIKKARNCHTKMAWKDLFKAYGETIANASTSKPVQDLFRLLSADPQSVQYDPEIWAALITGALASWDLELAKEITDRLKNPSPKISIPAAKTYLDCGQPTHARSIALKSLRLSRIPPSEKLQLHLIVARTYAEQGKRQKCLRLLTRIRASATSTILAPKQKAEILADLGRLQYFLGRYSQAGEYFRDAANLYEALQEWEGASKALFNTAACYLNSGIFARKEAFKLIEKCRNLAIQNHLKGPLGYCEAAYGMDAYERGRFLEALKLLRKALELLPQHDHSFRRLHLLSGLAHTHLALGQFHLAQKIGKQALKVAARDESTKSHCRYLALEAELLWEEGAIDQSQTTLQNTCSNLEKRGVHTLDEMAALSRIFFQSALLGCTQEPVKPEISDLLQHNTSSVILFNFARAHIILNQDKVEDASTLFRQCEQLASLHEDKYHQALSTLGVVQVFLRKRLPQQAEVILHDLSNQIESLGDGPLRTPLQFSIAAVYYQRGQFNECRKILRGAQRLSRKSFSDAFALEGWLATIEGRSFRMAHPWQKNLLARYTKIYFSPLMEIMDESNFRISNHYIISLDRHPALATMLQHLLQKNSLSSSAEDIQTNVWNQSLNLQGWQQKIRNTIMRLRDFFPQTMAPLILHDENIALFKDAIEFKRSRQGATREAPDIQRVLLESPMSSQELARTLDLSPATTKRLLKKLAEQDAVVVIKNGRNVVYQTKTTKRDLTLKLD